MRQQAIMVVFLNKACLALKGAGLNLSAARLLSALILLELMLATATAARLPPGLELEVGGPGAGEGKLGYVNDITFGPDNHLYVLDGARWDKENESATDRKPVGNLLVQKFSNDGRFVSQFSIQPENADRVGLPQRIAVDDAGDVYLTSPQDGRVERYDAQGKLKQTYAVPGAMGITTWRRGGKQVVAVVGGMRLIVQNKWTQVGGEEIAVIDPKIGLVAPVRLEKRLENVADLTAGSDGHLYVLAGRTIQKINPQGKIVQRIGSNPTFGLGMTRAGDGSEPMHSVAVDSTGQVYSWGWGNPGTLVRYSGDMKRVSLRGGEFKFGDYWSPHSSYVPLAVDANDKVWVGVPDMVRDIRLASHHHTRGWVLRVRPDFLDPSVRVKTFDARLLGMRPGIYPVLPYSVAYDTQPAGFELVLPEANRMVDNLSVKWVAYDMYKTPVDQGTFDVKMVNGEKSVTRFNVTPPKFGWYTIECQLIHDGDVLTTLGQHLGVTPRYEGMVALADGESKGGWEDVPRQVFSGLSNLRLHPRKESEESLAAAEKYGAVVYMQITDHSRNLTPEFVRPILERFKGKVKYWEVINEPNFSISAEKLAEVHAWIYPMIKEIDPEAKVMGPAVCGIHLEYHERFFKAGGAKYLDILAIHDYEGHNSLDLYHWRWKFEQLRKLMAEYGIADRPIWQTERGFSGQLSRNTVLGNQAIRMGFHRDLLESLGVPPEHNNHYYLNQGGYNVTTYVWSHNGPHAAAMSLRTRYALTLGQKYQGLLDFGPHGNDMFFGLHYAGDDRQTLVLRNMGTIRDMELELAITGGRSSVTIFDAFGNQHDEPITNGKIKLTIGQMPTYVRLSADQQATPQQFDFGRNIAPAARFSYSGSYEGDIGTLTNGIMENIHHGHPWGGSDGRFVWRSKLTTPQILELRFAQPRTIHALQMFSTRADNTWCSLREYDLEYYDGKDWVVIEQVRRQVPESSPAISADAIANTWYQDDSIYVHTFAPITTDRFRVRFIRTTHGFAPDDKVTVWDSVLDQQVQLREFRVFSPQQPIELAATVAGDARTARPEREPVELRLNNRSKTAFNGKVRVLSPPGWSLEPAEPALTVAAGQEQTLTVHLRPPAEVPASYNHVDLGLLDDAGRQVDVTTAAVLIGAPARLEPGAPQTTGKGTTLSVTVVNTGEEPIEGKVRLELSGPRRIAPMELPFGPVEPQKRQDVKFSVPGIDLTRERWATRYQALVGQIVVQSSSQDLAVRPWLVFGPLPHDASSPLPARKPIDLSFVTTDMIGNEIKWRPVNSNGEGFVNLGAVAQDRKDNAWAYAYVLVQSPENRQAVLAVGADDSAEVQVNGESVLTAKGGKRLATQKPVRLKAGWNEILVRTENEKDGWGFYCDILGTDGKPMIDLRWSAQRR